VLVERGAAKSAGSEGINKRGLSASALKIMADPSPPEDGSVRSSCGGLWRIRGEFFSGRSD
jgi:hypothetical protein